MSAVIDDLPEEVLALIFSRFDLLEKLKLREVCSRWKLIIESFRIKDVSIVDSNFNRSDFSSYLGTESVNCQSLIYSNPSLYQRLIGAIITTVPDSLHFVCKHPMFAGLKSMYLSFESINNFSFEKCINPHFPQLEQLTCSRLSLGKTCLSLANLKVLSLYPLANARIRILLELPSMYQLSTDLSLDAFEFVHPQTVTHLLLFYDDVSIARLSNLKYLYCYVLVHAVDTVNNLPKLKEIHLEYQEDADERMAQIYSIKERLGKHDLKMFVHGIDYEAYRDHPTLPVEDSLRSLLSSGSSPFPPISEVAYRDLFDGQPIPSDLKSKLSIVRSLSASRIERSSVDSFFSFLDDCPNLFVLNLTETFDERSDRQACYDRLPSHCRFLRELALNPESFRPLPNNLNFVLNFSNLQRLKINERMFARDIIEPLFGKLKYFQCFESNDKKQTKITKQENYLGQSILLSVTREDETYAHFYYYDYHNDFLNRNFNFREDFKHFLLKFRRICTKELLERAHELEEAERFMESISRLLRYLEVKN